MRGSRRPRFLKIVPIVILASGVVGLVVMELWNWLVPSIFGLRHINFWQALGLFLLGKLLFGGFHRHGGHGRWGGHMRERWARMNPEERERLRTAMRQRWNCQPGAGSAVAHD